MRRITACDHVFSGLTCNNDNTYLFRSLCVDQDSFMNKKSSPPRNNSWFKTKKRTHVVQSEYVSETEKRVILTGGCSINNKKICVARKDSDSCQINGRMSPESMKILQETRWSENGFIPSFKVTDKILIEAAMRTYKPHRSSSK